MSIYFADINITLDKFKDSLASIEASEEFSNNEYEFSVAIIGNRKNNENMMPTHRFIFATFINRLFENCVQLGLAKKTPEHNKRRKVKHSIF